MNLGAALAATLEDFGIKGYVAGIEGDAAEVTVWRYIQTSDGKSVALFEDPVTGAVDSACVVAETFDLHAKDIP